MSENTQSKPIKTTNGVRRVFIYIALLLIAFLLGFVPMWWLRSQCSSSLVGAERQSNLANMQNTLASAAIDARRGDYEAARQAASDFYSVLQTEMDKGVESVLSQAETTDLQPLLTRRDQIITLLARGDLASADLLSDVYVSFRELVNP